ncbi:putative sodium-coupled neutral amino acid transporter 7 [Gigantopelta aegis]|uniref:putative sodium-coupled neutral amino acid transporter 7 n=1 Tax=Gigantopelta aegis TaxID=1735272 RepID=UPI001B88CECF|nr:putative sodium-coupled neutral amino acid transporter 7 [Gigantopelta aegis]
MSIQARDDDGSDEVIIEDEEQIQFLTKSRLTPQHVKGSSWFSSAFLVVNAALGAGLLNFPAAYDLAGGVVVAVTIQTIFLVFIVAAIMILAYCSDIKQSTTYQDVVYSVCGKWAHTASAVTLLIYCYGTCITFLIIIGDQWEEFFLFVDKTKFCNDPPIYMDRSFTIVVSSLILILPMCFPKRIDFLKYASFVGVIGILYVVLLVTVKYFSPHPTPKLIKTKPDSWMDIFLVVPAICFAYQCHVSIIPIYSCMEKRNIKEFSKTVALAMVLCVFSYTGTAALGYLQFGHGIASDILLSFDPDPEVLVAVVLIAIKTYTTYPILLFCGRAAFDSVYLTLRKIPPEVAESHERPRRIITTTIWFATTLVLAVFIPNIGVVIQILGAFAAIFIFIYPGMCLLKICLDRLDVQYSRRLKGLAIFSLVFIVLGSFIFGLTLSQALIQDIGTGGVKPDKSGYTCGS